MSTSPDRTPETPKPMAKPTGRPPGRPSTRTPERENAAVEAMASSLTAREINADPNLPRYGTILQWEAEGGEFAERIARARRIYAARRVESGRRELFGLDLEEVSDRKASSYVSLARERANYEMMIAARMDSRWSDKVEIAINGGISVGILGAPLAQAYARLSGDERDKTSEPVELAPGDVVDVDFEVDGEAE